MNDNYSTFIESVPWESLEISGDISEEYKIDLHEFEKDIFCDIQLKCSCTEPTNIIAKYYLNKGKISEVQIPITNSEWQPIPFFEPLYKLYMPLFLLKKCPVHISLTKDTTNNAHIELKLSFVSKLNDLKKRLWTRNSMKLHYQAKHSIGLYQLIF